MDNYLEFSRLKRDKIEYNLGLQTLKSYLLSPPRVDLLFNLTNKLSDIILLDKIRCLKAITKGFKTHISASQW
jgi:hypothetical protein